MAYSDITLTDLKRKFNIGSQIVDLFDKNQINPLQPDTFLQQQLEEAGELPMKSEKSRSELVVFPILMNLRRTNNDFFTIHSGDVLKADEENGLTGPVDFILAKDNQKYSINTPITTIVDQAENHDIEFGIYRCAAQMYGAFLFNQQLNTSVDKIYGCTTTGDDWKFMCLENDMVFVDQAIYYRSDIEKILGIFQFIIDYYKAILN